MTAALIARRISFMHRGHPLKVAELAEPVRLIADPNNRGRQYLARTIGALAGTRLSGFVLDGVEANNNRKASAIPPASFGKRPKPIRVIRTIRGPRCQPRCGWCGWRGCLLPNPKAPVCAQFGGGVSTNPPADPPAETTINGKTVWLHPECRRFYEGSAR